MDSDSDGTSDGVDRNAPGAGIVVYYDVTDEENPLQVFIRGLWAT